MEHWRVFVVIFAGIVIIGLSYLIEKGTFVLKPKETELQPHLEINEIKKEVTLRDLADKDTDRDGLKDWEEALWGTNLNKVDTDEDGINDFDMVKAEKEALNKKIPGGQREATTTTALLAQQLLASIFILGQSGNFSEENLKRVSEAVAENINKIDIPEKYTLNNLMLLKSDDKDALKSYSRKLVSVAQKYNGVLGNELLIVVEALTNQSRLKINELKIYSILYNNASKEFLSIAVPKSLSIPHLKMVNSLSAISISIEKMAHMLDDPVLGLSGVRHYRKESEIFSESLGFIEASLVKNGIIKKI